MVGAYGNKRIEVREKAVVKSKPDFCYTPAGSRGAAPNLLSLDKPTHKQVLAFLEPNLNLVVGAWPLVPFVGSFVGNLTTLSQFTTARST